MFPLQSKWITLISELLVSISTTSYIDVLYYIFLMKFYCYTREKRSEVTVNLFLSLFLITYKLKNKEVHQSFQIIALINKSRQQTLKFRIKIYEKIIKSIII